MLSVFLHTVFLTFGVRSAHSEIIEMVECLSGIVVSAISRSVAGHDDGLELRVTRCICRRQVHQVRDDERDSE